MFKHESLALLHTPWMLCLMTVVNEGEKALTDGDVSAEEGREAGFEDGKAFSWDEVELLFLFHFLKSFS
jgi:hypothetical protein